MAANGWSLDFNSDYYAWQRLLDIWMSQGHAHAWISEDLFPTRFPLYLLLDLVGIEGHRGVVVASMLLTVGAGLAFASAFLVSGDVSRPLRARSVAALALTVAWTPAAWASAGFFTYSDGFLLNPNSRPLELGLAVLAVAWIDREAAARPWRWDWRAALIVVALAFLWLSDPFVLYLVGIPAAVVAAFDLLVAAHRRIAGSVVALVLASGLLSWLARQALGIFDVTAVPVAGGHRYTTSLGDVPDRARHVFDALATLLGISGSNLTASSADDLVLAWLRLGVVVLAVAGAVCVVRSWSRSSLLARTLLVAVVADLMVVTGTNIFRDPNVVVGRYLTVALVGIMGLAVIAIERLPGRVSIAGGAIVSVLIVGVIITSAVSWYDDRNADPVAEHVALDHDLAQLRWHRVYGSYFFAIRQDQVDDAIRWVTVDCSRNGTLRLTHFNNDSAVLRGSSRTIAVALEPTLGCTVDDLGRVYGAPTDVITVDGVRFAEWTPAPKRLVTLR